MTSNKDRPADTPAYRRYLQQHPEAADLSAAELTDHAFRQAMQDLEAIRRLLDSLEGNP
ncbi:MAG: hypothetical protein ACYC2H_10665 [Thermoplasmatota archaeon]